MHWYQCDRNAFIKKTKLSCLRFEKNKKCICLVVAAADGNVKNYPKFELALEVLKNVFCSSFIKFKYELIFETRKKKFESIKMI